MKTKKEYICPTIEILSTEMPLVCWSVNTPGTNGGSVDVDGGDLLDARQNDFTITEDSDDDW